MRGWPVALFAAVLLSVSSQAEPRSTYSGPGESAPSSLTVTVSPTPVRTPAPEAVSFFGVGLLALVGLARRKRLPV